MVTADWRYDGHFPYPTNDIEMTDAGVGLVLNPLISPPTAQMMPSATSFAYPIPHAPKTLMGKRVESGCIERIPGTASNLPEMRLEVIVP
jgi:hypothetical protein